MANDRYVSAIEGFTTTNEFYEAAEPGAFNQQTDGQFSAFCLFYLLGSYQELGASSAASMFLWGNLIDDTGWSLSIVADGDGQPVLRMSLGGGASTQDFDGPLGDSAYVERLIHAAILVDDTYAALAINGTVVNYGLKPTIDPSAAAARLGLSPDDDLQAAYAGIVACGYSQLGVSTGNARGLGVRAAEIFRASRASLVGAQMLSTVDRDWTHRYEARQLGQGVTGTLQKNATGQALLTPPIGAMQYGDLIDVARSFTPTLGVEPVNLLQQGGTQTSHPNLTSIKNPDWYMSSGFVFPPD